MERTELFSLIQEYYGGNDSKINRLVHTLKPIALGVAGAYDYREACYKVSAFQFLRDLIKVEKYIPNEENEVPIYCHRLKKALKIKMSNEYDSDKCLDIKQDNSKQDLYDKIASLCKGNLEETAPIVKLFIPLAVSIAVKTKGPGVPKDEINAQALFALTHAVNAFGKLNHREPKVLAKFIRTTVHRSLKDFINEYPLMKVPRTTQRDWTKTNKAEPPKQVDAEFIEEMAIFEQVFNAIDGELEGLIIELGLSSSELMILESLLEGKNQEEIADKVNLARETVTRKVRRIRIRAKEFLL